METLSFRKPPQLAQTVSKLAEATVGSGTSTNPFVNTGVFVEDCSDVLLNLTHANANSFTIAKVQANGFTPLDTDTRWVDVATFSPLDPGTKQVIIQNHGYKWFRFRALAQDENATCDVGWSGTNR
jgi:hypothetical protein